VKAARWTAGFNATLKMSHLCDGCGSCAIMYVRVEAFFEFVACLQVDGRCRNELVAGPEFGLML
jgi:hypothetical protein